MQRLEVGFHALSAGGDAVGRDAGGRTVFAPLAAPGDQAEVEIVQEHARFVRAHVVQLRNLSPQRVVPPCPFYWREERNAAPQPECGGCQLQHIEYSMQRESKRDFVVQALKRIGGVANTEQLVAPCLAAPQTFAYRNKADYVVAAQNPEQNGRAQNTQIGFFKRDSHRLVDVSHCLIQQQPNNLVLEAVRQSCAAGLVTPFDSANNSGLLRRVVARTATNGEALLIAVTTPEAWPQEADFVRFVRERVPQLVGVLRRVEREGRGRGEREETRLLDGRNWLEETVEGLALRVQGDGFFQINSWMTPLLLQTALRLAQVQPGERVLDLYCGVGLFALAMARAGADVTGIEQNRAAVEMARENAKRNNLRAEFVAGDTARVLQQRAQNATQSKRRQPSVDLVVLDPPRAGAAPCLPEIARLQPRRIVYVSCDCATLARDVRFLEAAGYRLAEVVPLDLFPQTAHVEAVARLERLA